MKDFNALYDEWLNRATEYRAELAAMSEDDRKEAFYKDLEFGTAGLRCIIGAGTNRLNSYTIGRVTDGQLRFAAFFARVRAARGGGFRGARRQGVYYARVAAYAVPLVHGA